jgi:hypothetical protein
VSSAQAVPRSYKEDNGGNQVSSVWESVKKRVSWKEAGIQRGLERQWLMKTQQAGKSLACAVVICKVQRSAMAM